MNNSPVSFGIKLKSATRDEIRRIRLVEQANESLFETLQKRTAEIMRRWNDEPIREKICFHYVNEDGDKFEIQNEEHLLKALQTAAAPLTLIVGPEISKVEWKECENFDVDKIEGRPLVVPITAVNEDFFVDDSPSSSSSLSSTSSSSSSPSTLKMGRKEDQNRRIDEKMEKKKMKMEDKMQRMETKCFNKIQKLEEKQRRLQEKERRLQEKERRWEEREKRREFAKSLSVMDFKTVDSSQLPQQTRCGDAATADWSLREEKQKSMMYQYKRSNGRHLAKVERKLSRLENKEAKLATLIQQKESKRCLDDNSKETEKYQHQKQKMEKKQQKLLARQEFWMQKEQDRLQNVQSCDFSYSHFHHQPQCYHHPSDRPPYLSCCHSCHPYPQPQSYYYPHPYHHPFARDLNE